jgi:hypothetical protein
MLACKWYKVLSTNERDMLSEKEGAMKWVVDGVAYNTATSTVLARKEWSEKSEDDRGRIGPYFESTLYQTQKGAYFVHKSTSWWDPEQDSPHGPLQPERDDCIPLTAEQASAWLLKGNVKISHNPFGDVPEAAAETEPGATIYLRVPASLKHRVDKAASEAGMSSNAWVMRCIEACLKTSPSQLMWAGTEEADDPPDNQEADD